AFTSELIRSKWPSSLTWCSRMALVRSSSPSTTRRMYSSCQPLPPPAETSPRATGFPYELVDRLACGRAGKVQDEAVEDQALAMPPHAQGHFDRELLPVLVDRVRVNRPVERV